MTRSTIIFVFLLINFLEFKAQVDSSGALICLFPTGPKFPGGDSGLIKYINDSLKKPTTNLYRQGTVYVRFKIDCKGVVSDCKIQKGLDSLANNEALRLIRNMPLWVPETCDKWPDPNYYNLPIKFK